MSFSVKTGVEKKWEDATKLKLTLGGKEAMLWCALTGVQSNLEENLAMLLKLEHGQDVHSDKNAIRKALKAKGLRIEQLVANAKNGSLKVSFPSLLRVFEDICVQNRK